MNSTIRFDDRPAFDESQREGLRCLVGLMIPASERHGVPGADDALIFAEILEALRPQAARVIEMLRELDRFAQSPFARLAPAQRKLLAEQFRKNRSAGLMAAVSATVQCYYRDDRVMRSLDMEARPPFPKGFEVEQGDWSLLDPVRGRDKLYRDAP